MPNDTYGSGRVDALTAAEKEIPSLSAPATQSVSGGGGTLQATGTDPNNCPLTYSWTGTCGAGTGSMPAPNCSPGANSVNLSASNNGVTFTPDVAIKVTATSFAVTASPASASVTAGQSATYTISVSPQMGAFSSAVTLACSSASLPSMSTCAFSQASVTPGSNVASSKLTISTTAAGSTAWWRSPWRRLPRGEGPLRQTLPAALLSVVVLVLAWRRRQWDGKVPITQSKRSVGRFIERRFALACMLASLAIVIGCLGCGGGGSNQAAPPPTNPGTPSGTYTVTVTGTFGALSQSAAVTLKVQ